MTRISLEVFKEWFPERMLLVDFIEHFTMVLVMLGIIILIVDFLINITINFLVLIIAALIISFTTFLFTN